MFITEIRLFVLGDESFDLLLIFFFNYVLIHMNASSLARCIKFNRLDGHHSHKVIGRVAKVWALKVDASKIVHCETGFIEIDDLASSEKHKPIEHLENVRVRLMDRANDCASILDSEITKDFHDVCSSERIKTSCWLVKEDQTRVSDQLDTDGSTLTFTTGHTFNKRSSNSGVRALSKLKIVNQSIDTSNLFGQSARQLQLCGKLETFSHSHGLEQDIILLDIGRKRREIAAHLLNVLSVNED